MSAKDLVAGFLLVALGVVVPTDASANAGVHDDDGSLPVGPGYARAIRLQHSGDFNGRIIAATTSDGGTTDKAVFYESLDEGKDLGPAATPKSTLILPAGGRVCCGTLYELPSAAGGSPAGTLLYSVSTHTHDVINDYSPWSARILVYQSRDHGATWTQFSGPLGARDDIPSYVDPDPDGDPTTDDKIVRPSGGLWEPEFTTGKNGELIGFFSDKWKDGTAVRQKLVEKKLEVDGGWSLPQVVQPSITRGTATDPGGQNPGMVIVRRLPSGKYFMVYELCGRPDNVSPPEPLPCAVYSRNSTDGWTWTAKSDSDPNPRKRLGDLIKSQGSRYFRSAPGLGWVPTADGDGALVVVGKAAFEGSNVPAKDGDGNDLSGRIVMISPQNGQGKWYEIEAPVAVPNPWGNGTPDSCRNYSSALLPSADGQGLLEFAADVRPADGDCVVYFDSGSIPRSIKANNGGFHEASQTMLTGNQLHYFAPSVNEPSDLRHWISGARNTGAWVTQAKGKAAAVAVDATQHVFARNSSGQLMHAWWNREENLRSEALPLPPGSVIAGDPAALLLTDTLHVAAIDTNGVLLHWWWDRAARRFQVESWGADQALAGRPTLMALGTGVVAFARGTDGRLQRRWKDSQVRNETWNPGGSTLKSDPAAISIGGQQNVFAVDGTDHLRRWSVEPGGTSVATAGWGPAVESAGRPAVMIAGAGWDELHVYVRSTTNPKAIEHWWRRTLVNESVQHETRGVNAFTDPAAIMASGQEHLFTVGSLDRLWDYWKADGTTHTADWGL